MFLVFVISMYNTNIGVVVRGESPGCRLFGTASMLEWLWIPSPTTHRGAVRNTLRVVTARVFYVLMGSLTSPFILNNSVETAAPFNVVSHDVVSREINLWKRFDLLRGSNLWPLAPSAGCLTARPPELTIIRIFLYIIPFINNMKPQKIVFRSHIRLLLVSFN